MNLNLSGSGVHFVSILNRPNVSSHLLQLKGNKVFFKTIKLEPSRRERFSCIFVS